MRHKAKMKKPTKHSLKPAYKKLALVGTAFIVFTPIVYTVLFLTGGVFCESTATNTCNLEGDILRHLSALLTASILFLIGIILLIVSFFKYKHAKTK